MHVLDPIQKTEDMKIGRKVVGQVLTHKNGQQILLINRTTNDIIRGQSNKMISHGMETGEAGWPVETILLSRMKMRGINLIAIKIKANKAVYVSRLSSWIRHSTTYTRRKRNGSYQKVLPFEHFVLKAGIMKL